MRFALGIFCLFVTSCASIDSYPRRACLYTTQNLWRSGKIVEERLDGARLFKFDDELEGDHGYLWIDSEDKRLRPCKQVGMMDVAQ